MERAKIGIIVPVYNVEQFLEQCIESLLNQSLTDIQIVLVDDGAKDSSGQIIDEYAKKDDRIVAIHKKNGGISSARNEGIKHICAEYLTFVDSDDWVDRDMYLHMYQAACSTGADIISTDIQNRDIVTIDKNILPQYFIRGDVSCCNKIFRFTDDIKNNFLFDSNDVSIDIKGCYDFFKKCKKWTIIPGAYYNYRQDNLSYGRSGFSSKDLNCVNLTEQVAKDVLNNFPRVYELAINHVVHAKLDIISKVANYGCKNPAEEKEFHSIQKQYIREIRKRLFYSFKSEYFTRNEKFQMAIMSVSYPLYIKMKRVYLKKASKNIPKSIKI